MIIRKLIGFYVYIVVILFIFHKLFDIPLTELVPLELTYLGYTLLGVLSLFAAVKLGRLLHSPCEEFAQLKRGYICWSDPMRDYTPQRQIGEIPDLIVRESRVKMITSLVKSIIMIVIFVAVSVKFEIPVGAQYVMAALVFFMIVSNLQLMPKILRPKELVIVSWHGLRLPTRYGDQIKWEDIQGVQIRQRGEEGDELIVDFNNPANMWAWRGSIGKIRGFLAHENNEGNTSVSLSLANVGLLEIRTAIDHYLVERDMEVTVR